MKYFALKIAISGKSGINLGKALAAELPVKGSILIGYRNLFNRTRAPFHTFSSATANRPAMTEIFLRRM